MNNYDLTELDKECQKILQEAESLKKRLQLTITKSFWKQSGTSYSKVKNSHIVNNAIEFTINAIWKINFPKM